MEDPIQLLEQTALTKHHLNYKEGLDKVALYRPFGL